MLRCPKCSRIYQNGSQRFCSYDGGRLLPVSQAAKTGQANNTFTALLQKAKATSSTIEESQASQRFGKPDSSGTATPNFRPSSFPSKIFSNNQNSSSEKQVGKVIKMSDVPPSQAALGDRKQNPTGRLPLTWINTKVLVGQTVKGRYLISDQIAQDEFSVCYIAEDKILVGKKVYVKVLMEVAEASDPAFHKLIEERVRLAHLRHPNIAAVIDSGELPEGKQFLISEHTEGEALSEVIQQAGQFTPARAGKIVREIGEALSEAHQNGILHRDLNPEKITLFVTESHDEHVKVGDFAIVEDGDLANQSPAFGSYRSPEQNEGKSATIKSDIYSQAVIAYRLLTGRLPFNPASAQDLLTLQKRGLSIMPTNLRFDITTSVDDVFERALSPDPDNRFTKAREFGEALQSALNEHGWSNPKKGIAEDENILNLDEVLTVPASTEEKIVSSESFEDISHTPQIETSENVDLREDLAEEKEVSIGLINLPKSNVFDRKTKSKSVQATDDLAWKERAIPAPFISYLPKILLYGGLLALIAGGGFALMKLAAMSKQQNLDKTETPTTQIGLSNVKTIESENSADANSSNSNAVTDNSDPSASAENQELDDQARKDAFDNAEPPQRIIQRPPNTTYFQNTKENLDGDLAKNFRGFSMYYPNTWKEIKDVGDKGKKNFSVFKKAGDDGFPIEQLAVSHYESSGMFTTDRERFPKMVQTLNTNLSNKATGIPNYKEVSEGVINLNGRNCYEVKFQGFGEAKNGKQIAIWGRVIFVPPGKLTIKTGLRLVLLASSLSPDVTGVEEVGVKGDLAGILQTFEPDRDY